jgi:hypothetical protein
MLSSAAPLPRGLLLLLLLLLASKPGWQIQPVQDSQDSQDSCCPRVSVLHTPRVHQLPLSGTSFYCSWMFVNTLLPV